MKEDNDISSLEKVTDEELARALQNGNETAFEELVRRYEGRVYAIAYRVTLNREDALDVAQEVFVKVYHKIGSWRPQGTFASWVTRLAVNQAIDTLRKRRRQEHVIVREHLEKGYKRAALETSRESSATETGERIQAALQCLSPTQRAVFGMRHYEGLQLNEIADALNCTVGSVKVHLFRAIRKLQEELKDLR